MSQVDLFYRFGLALAIAFLIGLQREVSHGGAQRETFAGVRTFSLLGLLGCAGAFASEKLASPWAFVAVIGVVGGWMALAYSISARQGDIGLTTEVAALITIVCGGLAYWGQFVIVAALAITTTALLSFKFEIHALAQRITHADIVATLKFAAITAIILPLLPNNSFGPPPFDALNPYRIWLMVVLISGVSFFGYLLIKIVGSQRGIGLTGVLGGLVSSTAVTLSFTRRSHESESLTRSLALGIMLSWAVMFARVFVLIGVLNIELLGKLWLPLTATCAATLVFCVYLHRSRPSEPSQIVALVNPFELGPAIKFGLLFGGILLITRAAQIYLGNAGLLASSLLAGIADVDAITLSMAELSQAQDVALSTAARAIMLAIFANTLLKGGIVFFIGASPLRRVFLPGLVFVLIVIILLIALL